MEKRNVKLRDVLCALVFVVFIGLFFVLNIVIPAPTVLVSERRIPAKMPEITVESVLSGSFMNKFDDYAADRFVFRDTFRMIRSYMVFDLYMQTDKSGLYRDREVGLGEFRQTNETSFRQTSERIKKAAVSLDGLDMNIYYSLVPDKSVFAGRYMPGFDQDAAEAILFDVFGEYEYIRLIDKLSADVFYKTDIHWNQSKIKGVASDILGAMGANTELGQFTETKAGLFKGVYAGQLALPVDADTMYYLELPGLKVSYLNEKTLEFEPGLIYETERFNGIDPYDLFLRGPQPLIIIENDAAPKRELYMFRDSFGSSLAPILAASYSRVIVIDLRYIHLSLIDKFVEFVPGSDVLFIYSSQIFNNPSILQT